MVRVPSLNPSLTLLTPKQQWGVAAPGLPMASGHGEDAGKGVY